MTSAVRAVQRKEAFHGVRQIVRLNWPLYTAAAAVISIALPIVHSLSVSALSRGLLQATVGLASLWLVGSLVASWMVYDHSNLMKGDWIRPALGFRPRTWINIHAGLDETTPVVRRLFSDARGRVFDIFDRLEMSEPSIARAKRLAPQTVDTECVDFRRLPALSGAIDAVLLLLSAHELRTDEARSGLFNEIRRILAPSGRVVVAEHLRDWPNFIAFGPGFLHFHSRRTWTRAFARAGLVVRKETSMTPFVRVFILGRQE